MDEVAERLYESIERLSNQGYPQVARALYRTMVDPQKLDLLSEEVETLLAYLPFVACRS